MTGATHAPDDTPVGLADMAGLLGVHGKTPYKWRDRAARGKGPAVGLLDEPDGYVSGVPWWWRSRIIAWHEQRTR